MSKYKNILVAGAALVALSGAAMAGGSHKSNDWLNVYLGLQNNVAEVFSHVDLYGEWIGGNVTVQSAAIGNNVSFITEGSTFFDNKQRQLADVGAELNVTLSGVGGDVDLSAIAICNNASVESTKSGQTAVLNDQRCMTEDPYAIANATITGAGSAAIAATSIANNLAVTAETGSLYAYNFQWNPAAVNAVVNANVADIGGDVSVTAAAIGNNVSVKSGFGN